MWWPTTVTESPSGWSQALLQHQPGHDQPRLLNRGFPRGERRTRCVSSIVQAATVFVVIPTLVVCVYQWSEPVPLERSDLMAESVSTTKMARHTDMLDLFEEKTFQCGNSSLIIIDDVLNYTEATNCYDWCSQELPMFVAPFQSFHFMGTLIALGPANRVVVPSFRRIFSNPEACFFDACKADQVHFDWALSRAASKLIDSIFSGVSTMFIPLPNLFPLLGRLLHVGPKVFFEGSAHLWIRILVDIIYVPIMLVVWAVLVLVPTILICVLQIVMAAVIWLPVALALLAYWCARVVLFAFTVLVDLVTYLCVPLINYFSLFVGAAFRQWWDLGVFWTSQWGTPAWYPITWSFRGLRRITLSFWLPREASEWLLGSIGPKVFFEGSVYLWIRIVVDIVYVPIMAMVWLVLLILALLAWVLFPILVLLLAAICLVFWVMPVTAILVVGWVLLVAVINLVPLALVILSSIAFVLCSVPLWIVATSWPVIWLVACVVCGLGIAVTIPIWPFYFMYKVFTYRENASTCFRVIVAGDFGNLPQSAGPAYGGAVITVAFVIFQLTRCLYGRSGGEWHDVAKREEQKTRCMSVYRSCWILLPCYAVYTDAALSVNFLQRGQPYYFMLHILGIAWLIRANSEDVAALRDVGSRTSQTGEFIQSIGKMFFADVVEESFQSIAHGGKKTNAYLLLSLNRAMTTTPMNLFLFSYAILRMDNTNEIMSPLRADSWIPGASMLWVRILAALASSSGDVGLITGVLLSAKSLYSEFGEGLRWYYEEILGPATVSDSASGHRGSRPWRLDLLRFCEAGASVITASAALAFFSDYPFVILGGFVATSLASGNQDCVTSVLGPLTPYVYVWPHKTQSLGVLCHKDKHLFVKGHETPFVTALSSYRRYFAVRGAVLISVWLLLLTMNMLNRIPPLDLAGAWVIVAGNFSPRVGACINQPSVATCTQMFVLWAVFPAEQLWRFTKSLILFCGFSASMALCILPWMVEMTGEDQLDAIVAHAQAKFVLDDIDDAYKRSMNLQRKASADSAAVKTSLTTDEKSGWFQNYDWVETGKDKLKSANQAVKESSEFLQEARKQILDLEGKTKQAEMLLKKVRTAGSYTEPIHLRLMVNKRSEQLEKAGAKIASAESQVKGAEKDLQLALEAEGGGERLIKERKRRKKAQEKIQACKKKVETTGTTLKNTESKVKVTKSKVSGIQKRMESIAKELKAAEEEMKNAEEAKNKAQDSNSNAQKSLEDAEKEEKEAVKRFEEEAASSRPLSPPSVIETAMLQTQQSLEESEKGKKQAVKRFEEEASSPGLLNPPSAKSESARYM